MSKPGSIHPTHAARAVGETNEKADTLELREEQLVPRPVRRKIGEIVVRREVEDLPKQLDVDAGREEIVVEHVPIGQIVKERRSPWQEDGAIIVPVYDEQPVVVKQLVLREELRIRRVPKTEHVVVQGTVQHDKLVIDDPGRIGRVHEVFPTAGESPDSRSEQPSDDGSD